MMIHEVAQQGKKIRLELDLIDADHAFQLFQGSLRVFQACQITRVFQIKIVICGDHLRQGGLTTLPRTKNRNHRAVGQQLAELRQPGGAIYDGTYCSINYY
jgi:hypothetical protein